MAITGFLKVPDIAGESRRVGHEDEIDVWGVSWAVEQAPRPIRARRARRRADIGPVVVRKFYDASSPYLAQAVEQGRAFDEVVLSLRKDSGEAHLDYLVITMENVIVTSYGMANDTLDADGEALMERVEFDFEQVTIKYVEMADDHSAGPEHEVELG